MRIIAGQARGKRLMTMKGNQTRPTSSRVREAIFNILFSRLGTFNDKTVLDLCAGSGAMALEALSRGAKYACLIEESPHAIKIIKENLLSCGYLDHADIMLLDVCHALKIIKAKTDSYDLIFVDPPYNCGLSLHILQLLGSSKILATQGLICIESGNRDMLPESSENLVCIDRRRYGSTQIHFYSHMGQDMS